MGRKQDDYIAFVIGVNCAGQKIYCIHTLNDNL